MEHELKIVRIGTRDHDEFHATQSLVVMQLVLLRPVAEEASSSFRKCELIDKGDALPVVVSTQTRCHISQRINHTKDELRIVLLRIALSRRWSHGAIAHDRLSRLRSRRLTRKRRWQW